MVIAVRSGAAPAGAGPAAAPTAAPAPATAAAEPTAAEPTATAARATRWEERVMRAAHPVAYPLLCAIRRPVVRVPRLGVVVTDAALLRGVLVDPSAFAKNGPGAPSDLWTPVLGPRVLLNMEGAEHAELRRRLAPLFTPAAVDDLVDRTLAAPYAALTERLAAGGTVELVDAARRYASAVISTLVGLPPDVVDDRLFRRIATVTGAVRLSRPRMTPAQVRHARGVMSELTVHAARAWHEGDPATVPGRMRTLGLDEEESLGAVGAFVLTGTETLVAYLPRLVCLLHDTGWLERLAADRTPIDAAISEGLRVTTPSPVMLRSTLRETTIGEVAVRHGDRIILATFLANRVAPGFDPVGHPAASLRRLWFGAGAHFCLGAPLAMAQVRGLVDAVLDAASVRPLAVRSRRVARGVLIPGYASVGLGPVSRVPGR
ncbi:cytochrome P450 [Agromyces aurantiacus]|uniref:Cytochrome P450 n=1 Tax=Agromyces aurantiacus TaxID=165814 RepID=A0ABV9R4R8_9MICO|nr:cytochrome P450 [Agromyces aurantiacus]MBM7505628.1 cytochrome P450 [Agromyces aurantiacus]